MHYNFGIEWLKAFRHSSERVCALYDDAGFVFEDVMLDQHNIDNKPDLLRLFALYANKDPENGFGIHNFKIRSYIGDKNSGLLRWEWAPEHCAFFIGLDVAGKPFSTQGHTFHMYENGLIKRESSWWDSAAILRQVGPVEAEKSLTGKTSGATKSGDVKLGAPAGTLEFSAQWADALGRDTDALRSLFNGDYFTLEYTKIDDHEQDTATDTEMLKAALGGIASGENGQYTFTANEYFGDARYGLTHWSVVIEGASTYRGIDTGGQTLETIGSTFHQFDSNGKIILESTCWEDNRVFEKLGLPIVRPHYWDASFVWPT